MSLCASCDRPLSGSVSKCGFCGAVVPKQTVPGLPPPSISSQPGVDPFAAAPERVRLTVHGKLGSREFILEPGDVLEIGSGTGPMVDLCPDNISRRHANLRIEHSRVVVIDLGTDGRGSTNGTFVNGCRLPAGKETELHVGDKITCASDPPLTLDIQWEVS